MSSATVIDAVQKNSTFIENLGTNITDFARNMTTAGGRVFKTAAAQGSSFAYAIVERSPIGVIVGGILFAAVNAKMAHTEWNRTSDEYDRRRLITHVVLGTAGVGVAAYTAAKVFGITLGTGSSTPVMVDLREVNDTVVVNATNATNATVAEVIANATLPDVPVANISVAEIPESVLAAPTPFFDNRTMSALGDYVAPITDKGVCLPELPAIELPNLPLQPEQIFVPTPIPAPEAPGMLDPVTSLYSWLRDKVKR